MRTENPARGAMLVAGAALMFASLVMMVRFASPHVANEQVVFFRNLFGLLVLLPLVLHRVPWPRLPWSVCGVCQRPNRHSGSWFFMPSPVRLFLQFRCYGVGSRSVRRRCHNWPVPAFSPPQGSICYPGVTAMHPLHRSVPSRIPL